MNALNLAIFSLLVLSCSNDNLKNSPPNEPENLKQDHPREIFVQFWEAPSSSELPAKDNSIDLSLASVRGGAAAALPPIAGAGAKTPSPPRAALSQAREALPAAPTVRRLPIVGQAAEPEAPAATSAADAASRRLEASINAAIRRPLGSVQLSDIYASIQIHGPQLGQLPAIWHRGLPIQHTQSFNGGGQNAGVHRLDIPGMGITVVRFEKYRRSQTKAELQGQKELRGHNVFAQASIPQLFRASPTGPLMLGQFMDSGGDDLMHGPPLSINAAIEVLKAAAILNRANAINMDAKADNFVRTTDRDGAMAIDLNGVKVVSLLERESLGSATFITPEGVAAARPRLASSVLPVLKADRDALDHEALGDAMRQIRQQVVASGPETTNNWLHGNTLYAAITRRPLNNWRSLGQGYHSSATLRSNLVAAVGFETFWVLPYVNDIVALLHPNPAQRGDAEVVMRRMASKAPGIRAVDWDAIPAVVYATLPVAPAAAPPAAPPGYGAQGLGTL